VDDEARAAAAAAAAEAQEAALQNPAEADDDNPLVSAVCDWYRDHVDGRDGDALAVRAWRALAHTVFKEGLGETFRSKTQFSKRLASFAANSKFEDPAEGTSLKQLLASLREELGPLRVYAWHALGGYWGGVSTQAEAVAHLKPEQHYPGPTRSLLSIEPSMAWDASALLGVGAVHTHKAHEMFRGMHGYLAQAGVDGVKIDAQSGLGAMGEGVGGGPSMVRQQVQAMEASAAEHFAGNRVVNCMCHSTENLLSYASTNLLRVADDFYPQDPASQPAHLASVAFNTLFLGEIGWPDWDMFQSTHPDARLHAAARAVGGCPIYVSDHPGEHDAELLQTLVLPDGTTLLGEQPGRPTRDILFSDVNGDGETALKVWNSNALTGVVGAFNVQGGRWCREKRQFVEAEGVAHLSLSTSVSPSDVETLPALVERAASGGEAAAADGGHAAVYLHKARSLAVVPCTDAVPVQLGERDWEVATVAPVQSVGAADERREWAALGLASMLNGGAAVLASSLGTHGFGRHASAKVRLRAAGDFAAYCRPAPRGVRLGGQPVDFEYEAASGLLLVPMEREAEEAELFVSF
jgi:raffinose synthase